MNSVVAKINCPNPDHDDATPSCAVYEDGSGFCFGCLTYFKEVSNTGIQSYTTTIQEKEDLVVSIARIESLPLIEHRGLSFHYDNLGYYLVWPDKTYYKRRSWPSPDRLRYVGPKGHTTPWFIVNSSNNNVLVLVEGEINALSMASVTSGSSYNLRCDLISPGGTSGFVDSKIKKDCIKFSKYSRIILMLDSDKGLEPATKCKEILVNVVPDIEIMLMDEDWNEILVKHGKEKVKEKLQSLGL